MADAICCFSKISCNAEYKVSEYCNIELIIYYVSTKFLNLGSMKYCEYKNEILSTRFYKIKMT